MQTIFVADIFGLSAHLAELAEAVSADYEILDPYNGERLDFESEAQAYEQFQAVCGLRRLTDAVNEKIDRCAEELILVGFSVGATAVWNVLADAGADRIRKAICFYGSRIRDNAGLHPRCDTFLVFPRKERHFSVSELSARLARTPGVRCIPTDFHHGFMNRLSVNFDPAGYSKYLDWLKQNVT